MQRLFSAFPEKACRFSLEPQLHRAERSPAGNMTSCKNPSLKDSAATYLSLETRLAHLLYFRLLHPAYFFSSSQDYKVVT